MAEYFYKENGRIIGPISAENVKSLCQRGKISASTEIRKDAGKWVQAGSIKGLSGHIPAVAVKDPIPETPPLWVGNVTPEIKEAEAPKGEIVLRRGRASFWRGYPGESALAFVIMPILALIAWSMLHWLAALPLALITAIWVTRLAIKIYSMEYVLTTERTTVRTGILTRRVVEVRHKDVRQIEVDQTIIQRLLGTGQLRVSSAASSGFEIDIDGIAHPDSLAADIRKRQSP